MNESSSERILDAAAIQQILPHRYPFLLVDRIVELSDETVVGRKAVGANEPYFQGHFPGDPVMPGVLMVEGMGQTGAVGVLEKLDQPSRLHLAAIRECRIRRRVIPGDLLEYRVTLPSPRRGFVRIKGSVTADGKPAAEATITLSIQSNPD